MLMLPITADYRRDGDDWAVTVRRGDRALAATAPGLIAARVQADQLVDELTGGHNRCTVVHMLDGDALAFSVAYLHTRHGLTVPPDTSTAHDQAIHP
ncbi:hypothetical protein [Saccharothrix obliqua]|uniref:hypothetical protein n=1 Tax=Saccharothrix obliqua TaxID=2861747 RepID=UPI001C5E1D0D|nr:hypothetical protein [Saccharothrix obliqua]MBW4720680.1 hypothetical protein [Saccharothrix obliqua]